MDNKLIFTNYLWFLTKIHDFFIFTGDQNLPSLFNYISYKPQGDCYYGYLSQLKV